MDMPQPLRALMAALDAARATGDGAALAALYLEDGLILLPDGTRLQGRIAIAAHYQAAAPHKGRAAAHAAAPKFYFFPPLTHVISTVNGRHGEKHAIVDILSQQADGSWLLALSSWTLR